MTDKPLYKIVDGEPMVSIEAMALLMGVTAEEIRREIDMQQVVNPGAGFVPPATWVKAGQRIRRECWAAIGSEAGMAECIDYLARR